MSTPQLPSRSQVNPSFSGSLPGFPESAVEFPDNVDDSLPLPDHFPEPYIDPDVKRKDDPDPRSSAILETGQTLVYCSTEHVVNKARGDGPHRESGLMDEVKEGLRRITDKYAAPGSLLRNSSVSSSASQTLAVTPKDTLPASPTPSITLPPSPSIIFEPVVNGAPPAESIATSPTQCTMSSRQSTGSHTLPNLNSLSQSVTMNRGGSVHGLSPLSVSPFSDASSDVSDASPSPALLDVAHGGPVGMGGKFQSVGGIALTASLGEGVSEQDVQQVEMFYRSHKSEVTVCHCLANLYIGCPSTSPSSPSAVPNPSNSGGPSPVSGSDLWEFVTTGIPLLVRDTGDHHRSRQLSLVVAEKGTGFVLWKDVVSGLSHYSCPHANFHTITLSSDTSKLAGLSFDDGQAAADFATSVKQLTADPEDDQKNSGKKGKKKRQESKKKLKYKPPKKMDISQPCCFQHITKLECPQMTGMMLPLPPNSFPPAPSSSVSSLSDVFHDSLSVSVARACSQSSELSDASAAFSDR